MDKQSDNWQALPLLIKAWFIFNFLEIRPKRTTYRRIQLICHVGGFLFCVLGLFNRAALEGGLILLTNAYVFHLLGWQADYYGIWYEPDEPKTT